MVFCGGGVVVFLWWCFRGGVFVVVLLWWCFCRGVFVVVFSWWCFCGGVVVSGKRRRRVFFKIIIVMKYCHAYYLEFC